MQLYYLAGLNQQGGFKTVTQSGVKTGIAGRWGWNVIEPAENEYTFDLIDRVQAAAKAARVPWSLSIKAGADTPHWLYDTGVAKFAFIWNQDYNYPEGSTQYVPPPWDLNYLSRWSRFIHKLGERYAGDATLNHVVSCGINGITQENSLPHTSEDAANWKTMLLEHGYETTAFDSLITNTQVQHLMLSCWPAAFPRHRIATMFTNGGFPFSVQGSDLGLTLLENMATGWPHRCILMSNAAGAPPKPLPKEIMAYAGKVPIAFQEVSAQGQGVQALIDNCAEAGARFLEVYDGDFRFC